MTDNKMPFRTPDEHVRFMLGDTIMQAIGLTYERQNLAELCASQAQEIEALKAAQADAPEPAKPPKARSA